MTRSHRPRPIEDALTDLDALMQAHPELRAPEAQARLMTWIQEQEMPETKHMKQIFTRMPEELIEALDRLTERRQREQPWTTVTRSDVVRELLYQALGKTGDHGVS